MSNHYHVHNTHTRCWASHRSHWNILPTQHRCRFKMYVCFAKRGDIFIGFGSKWTYNSRAELQADFIRRSLAWTFFVLFFSQQSDRDTKLNPERKWRQRCSVFWFQLSLKRAKTNSSAQTYPGEWHGSGARWLLICCKNTLSLSHTHTHTETDGMQCMIL